MQAGKQTAMVVTFVMTFLVYLPSLTSSSSSSSLFLRYFSLISFLYPLFHFTVSIPLILLPFPFLLLSSLLLIFSFIIAFFFILLSQPILLILQFTLLFLLLFLCLPSLPSFSIILLCVGVPFKGQVFPATFIDEFLGHRDVNKPGVWGGEIFRLDVISAC